MARRRTKADEKLFGYVLIIGLICAAIGWLKENVADQITQFGWVVIGSLVVAFFLFRIWRWSANRAAERQEQALIEQEAERERLRHEQARLAYLDWGVGRAVEMATHQKFASPHKLQQQAGVTNKQALQLLEEARERGLLFQAQNGRYYVVDGTAEG